METNLGTAHRSAFRNALSPLTKFPKKAANVTSPSKAGGGRSERSKLREGVRPGFRTKETAAVLMPPPECR